MSINIIDKHSQVYGAFDGGSIIENKPIGFPQESNQKPFSNIFYWANAISERGGLIDIHPHRGFEIISVVLEGKIEHYDTANKKWLELLEGDVQIIKSGSGISHAEKLLPNSRIFQIWFDPGLEKSLNQPAKYVDYKDSEFTIEENPAFKSKLIKKGQVGIDLDSYDVEITDVHYNKGELSFELSDDHHYLFYVISGNLSISGKQCNIDDIIFAEVETVNFEFHDDTRLFQIRTPKELPYLPYHQLYRK